jgi:hypothetical protein
MNIYWSSDLDFAKSCAMDLQEKRTSIKDQVNFMSCPAVRSSWQNVWMFGLNNDFVVEYDNEQVQDLSGHKIQRERHAHLKGTNIFNICREVSFFSKESVKVKITSPYFHKAQYQQWATFTGGVFDIGKWFRPIKTEIMTWEEKGSVLFVGGEPLFYAEFLTEEKISMVRYKKTPLLEELAHNLVNSPLSQPANFQGNLDSRYDAFERSEYRTLILEEIQANLLPAEG